MSKNDTIFKFILHRVTLSELINENILFYCIICYSRP